MELKMNKKSWHARLYKSAYYVCELPDNICKYWWKLLLAIVLFIPCWPGYIINWIDDKWDAGHGAEGKAIWWFLHVPITMVIAIIWMDAMYGKPEHWAQWVLDWGWYPIGIAVGIGLIVILILLGLTVVGCIYIKQWIDSKRDYSRAKNAVNKPNPLVEGWKAFKGKYCSKITWI